MDHGRKVLVLGNSVLLGALTADLRSRNLFDVTSLKPPWPDRKTLEALRPDIILVDLASESFATAFSLLENDPELVILGVSPDRNLVRTWRGTQHWELSMEGLVELIKLA